MDINRELTTAQIDELKENKWIDRYTRAVFIEYTIYNPNIDIFALTTILCEMPETGGRLPLMLTYACHPTFAQRNNCVETIIRTS